MSGWVVLGSIEIEIHGNLDQLFFVVLSLRCHISEDGCVSGCTFFLMRMPVRSNS